MNPRVVIVTWCQDPDALYGTTLVFRTLRTGFPAWPVTVVDNASLPDARREIAARAGAVGAAFEALRGEVRHAGLLAWLVECAAADGVAPLAIVDPDVVFWGRCEDFDVGTALVAGRWIPEHWGPEAGWWVAPRLHPSFLWIPDPRALARLLAGEDLARHPGIAALRKAGFSAFDSFEALADGRQRQLWEVGAALCDAVAPRLRAFDAGQLDRYDHLSVGTHLAKVVDRLPPDVAAWLSWAHARARAGELEALRGLWREQDAYFAARRDGPSDRAPGPPALEGARGHPGAPARNSWRAAGIGDVNATGPPTAPGRP